MTKQRTSSAAKRMWQRLADGEHADDLDEWVRQVAQALVREVFAPVDARRRRDAALRAVGFTGRINELTDLVATLDAHSERYGLPKHPPAAIADGADLVIAAPQAERDSIKRAVRRRRAAG